MRNGPEGQWFDHVLCRFSLYYQLQINGAQVPITVDDRVVNSMQDVPATQYVIRIFNGPLQGCEFKLSLERTLFVVGAEAKYCTAQGPLQVPEDAFYIPLEQGGCNFEVLLSANSRDGCTVRLLDDADVQELTVPFQVRQAIGGLFVALRPEDEDWDSELLSPLGIETDAISAQARPVPRLQQWLWGGGGCDIGAYRHCCFRLVR